MHGTGADGLVVAMNSGNAEGAKGPTSRARDMRQPTRGGTRGPRKAVCASVRSDWTSRMRRESHVRFRESGGV